MNGTLPHRHGVWTHEHHHHGPHRHVRLPVRSHEDRRPSRPRPHHGHTHGLVDPSIIRSQRGRPRGRVELGNPRRNCRAPSSRVRRVPLRRTARGPHPQHRRRTDRDPARRGFHPSQPTRRTLGGICRGRGDLHLRVRRRLRGDRSPDRSPPTRLPRSTRARRTHRLRGQRTRGPCSPACGPAARQPGTSRGRTPRACGRIRVARRRRLRGRRRDGLRACGSLDRSRDHSGDLRVTWQAWRTIRDHPGISGG